MVTKCDDDRPTDRQGEYRAICLGKVGRQSFAIMREPNKTNRSVEFGQNSQNTAENQID